MRDGNLVSANSANCSENVVTNNLDNCVNNNSTIETNIFDNIITFSAEGNGGHADLCVGAVQKPSEAVAWALVKPNTAEMELVERVRVGGYPNVYGAKIKVKLC